MDENNPYGPPQQSQAYQPPQAQPLQQPQAPALPELPWGPSDEIELNRLKQSMAGVQNDLYANKILPATANPALQQIGGRLAPLLKRQQQAKVAAQQEQQQTMMQQIALQESIEGHHAQIQAQAFPSTVATYTDPVSGRTEHFYQTKRGQWNPIEFKHEQAREELLQGAGGGESMAGIQPSFKGFPVGAGAEAVNAGSAEAPTPVASGNIEQMKEQSAATGQPVPLEALGNALRGQAKPMGGGPTVNGVTVGPRILNAAGEDVTRQQQEAYDRFRRTGSTLPESETGGVKGQLSQRQLQEIFKRVDAAAPRVDPNNPHLVLHRQDTVREMARQQVENHYRTQGYENQLAQQQTKFDQALKNQSELHRQDLANHKEMSDYKAKLHQEQPLTQMERAQLHLNIDRDLRKERKDWQAGMENIGKPLPDYLDPKNHDEMVDAKFDRAVGKATGQTPVSTKTTPKAKQTDAAIADTNKQVEQTGQTDTNPSTVGHDRVKELLPIVNLAYQHTSGSPTPGSARPSLIKMGTILRAADKESRPLSVAEARQYQQLHNDLGRHITDAQARAGWSAVGLKSDQKLLPPDQQPKAEPQPAPQEDRTSQSQREESDRVALLKAAHQEALRTNNFALVAKLNKAINHHTGYLGSNFGVQYGRGLDRMHKLTAAERADYESALEYAQKVTDKRPWQR